MTHLARIERRTFEGILASVFGGSLVAAITQHSWLVATVAVISGAVLMFIDWADIKDEEGEK